jgi:hypothetical protein
MCNSEARIPDVMIESAFSLVTRLWLSNLVESFQLPKFSPEPEKSPGSRYQAGT